MVVGRSSVVELRAASVATSSRAPEAPPVRRRPSRARAEPVRSLRVEEAPAEEGKAARERAEKEREEEEAVAAAEGSASDQASGAADRARAPSWP
jgi:hypothetical protein